MWPFTVEPEAPMQYSFLWLILAGLLIAAAVCLVLVFLRKRGRKRRVRKSDFEKMRIHSMEQIGRIELELSRGKLSNRDAYIQMSETLRKFVQEATGIKVTVLTRNEIRPLGITSLTRLVEQYYEPEFAEKAIGNIGASIHETKELIKKWNSNIPFYSM